MPNEPFQRERAAIRAHAAPSRGGYRAKVTSDGIHSEQRDESADNAVDVILQENAQLRQSNLDQQQDDAGPYGGTNNERAMYNAMNAVCVDVVKLQLEVRAKDQAIQKLKLQISSVQQLLQV